MRLGYAASDQMAQTVMARLPEAKVTRKYDGPQGYVVCLEHPDGRRAEIKSKADLKRVLPAQKRRKS